MMSPDLQRIQHIKEYCVAIGKTIIWETATVDIPALLQFCQEQLSENDI